MSVSHSEGGNQRDPAAWDRVRADLALGQRLTGTVVLVPHPGRIGIFVGLGLPVDGFVDAILLPFDPDCWPTVGTVTDFYIWWINTRLQIRLVPVLRSYRRADFDTFWLTRERRISTSADGVASPARCHIS